MMYKFFISALLFCLYSCQKEPSEPQESKQIPLMWGFALEGFPNEKDLLELLQTTTLNPQAVLFYLQWPKVSSQNLPAKEIRQSLLSIWKSGAIPCITWEPMYYDEGKRITIASKDILDGKYDTYLDMFAVEMKSLQNPVVVRFAHEMNLQEYHWGSPSQEEYGPKSKENYIAMYRYVYDRLKKQNATNILWAFCPNADSVPYSNDASSSWNLASDYYPGDAYVDILGMDGYDWGPSDNLAQGNIAPPQLSFEQIFSNLFHQLKNLAPNKPIMVFETASAHTGKKRNSWIKDALNTAKKWNISSIIWFQAKKEKNWQLNPASGDDISQIKQATSISQPWAQSLKKMNL